MRKSSRLWQIAALATVLNLSSSAIAQKLPTNMQLNRDNQPAAGVSIFVLAGANKFASGTPPTGTTSTAGVVVFPPGVLSANKPHTQMKLYEVCVNGQKVIFVIPKGTENQLPEDTDDCHKRYLGGFWLDGGPDVVIDLTKGVVTQTGGGPVTGPPQGIRPVSVDVGVSLGFKNLGGTSGESFSGTFTTPSSNALAGDVSASMVIGPLVFANTLYRASGITSTGGASLPGGGADNFNVVRTFQGDMLTAGFKIPLGGKFSVIPHAGGNFWHVIVATEEKVSSGTTTSTVSNSRGVKRWNWTAGAVVQLHVSGRWSLVFGYDYLPVSNAGMNVHLNEGFVGVKLRVL